MAFRRRRRFTRGRRAPGALANQPKWITSNFSAPIFDTGPPATDAFILVDPSTLYGAEDEEVNRILSIKRTLGTMSIVPTFESVALTSAVAHWLWAIYVIDIDDPDSLTLATGGGTIWNTQRVVQSGSIARLLQEIPAAQTSEQLVNSIDIHWDIRTNISLRTEEVLLFEIGLQATIAPVTSNLFAAGISRTLIVPP